MKMPGNMQNMMQQAQKMQQQMQEEVALIRVEASAGGGMVTVSMDGNKNVTANFALAPPVCGGFSLIPATTCSRARRTACSLSFQRPRRYRLSAAPQSRCAPKNRIRPTRSLKAMPASATSIDSSSRPPMSRIHDQLA